ncbi:MAG: hypothetical protein AAF560_06485 [Acidobacteriota bacterium]
MPKPTVESLLQASSKGEGSPVYLISGDLVAAVPTAEKLAAGLAKAAGCEAESHRRPGSMSEIFQNLRTFSLFAAAKVLLVVDSAIFADRSAAAELIDQAEEALPVTGELDTRGREGASRLLQALRVFGLEAGDGEASDVIGSLPKWALEGGASMRKKRSGRGRTAKQVASLREGLANLLQAARQAGLEGYAEGDQAELGAIISGGLPEGHVLVLAEHAVAKDHPVVKELGQRGAILEVGRVSSGRGGEWQGLETLTDQLVEETSVQIASNALRELAQRTLRQEKGWQNKSVDADSTARFAGEYRKLAAQAGSGQITRQMVIDSVEDRGEQDVWKIIDAIGNGRAGEALSAYRRYISASGDHIAARLSFFGLLAGFCRHLTAVGGVARMRRIPPGVQNYNQFKTRWAAKLQGELETGKNPLAGLHPFRLHRAYLAASRMDRDTLARLPWLVLETEMLIKGDSSEPDDAVSALMARLVAAINSTGAASGRQTRRHA